MSFTKWFKGSGGRSDRDSVAFKNSTNKKKTKKRSEEEDYYTQDDMEGYVYDNNYHYQPAPGLQPQGYGYSQRIAAKPRKPRLAAQEGHFDAEELTRRLLDQHRQKAAISSLNRAPLTTGRATGLKKPSKSYADFNIETASKEQEYRRSQNDAASAFKQTNTGNVAQRPDERAHREHLHRSNELAIEVTLIERTRAVSHQIQPQSIQVSQERPSTGQKDHIEKAKRRHSLSLEGAFSRMSRAWTSGSGGGELDQTSAASPPATSPTVRKQHSEDRKESPGTITPPGLLAIAMQNPNLPSSSQRERQQSVLAAENSTNINSVEKTTLSNESDDLSALHSPTTHTQNQSASQRFRVSSGLVKKSPSLLNLRQKLGMSSGSSGSSPASPVTSNSSGSGAEGATSPLTAASSAVADNLSQRQTQSQSLQTQSQSLQTQPLSNYQEKMKEKEKTRMNSKKSGFFAKLVGKKGVVS
ncbi:hypothetical protein B0T20DRAFT_454555 [Sordaria brevicollis]|uniref:Uncharacterized protein n=1 Tax=Sordaria brevicollis TaxID=83679 RepID=A0AAE0PCB4_SORBR|nr:hypothetical protein B0T20DRAFT_454555 [Sordaria brevicollis]